ncbi:MAG: chorismate mutase [Clostridia bacterium]|nr:chorismate mutase [Clostridia bacterium]
MNDLEKARKQINDVDKKMAELFEERMDAAAVVAAYKKENGLKIDDFAREEQIIKANTLLIKNEEYKPYYVNFLKENIELSKALQHKLLDGMRVAFSGVEGAFANIVAKRIFPDAKCIPHTDFETAYKAVEDGKCDVAVLPVENSFNGDVGKVLDLTFFGSLYISGIYEAEIVQNLLANKGATLESIKQVISHPQAIGQSFSFIQKHKYETVDAVNTAVAAKQVSQSGRTDIAAIGSEEAAEQFGLVNLAPHINESGLNTTRFAVFTRAQKTAAVTDRRFVMLFTVKNVAGSLGQAISVIGNHGFNLLAIKSRPTKDLIWDYYFYVEGEGNINAPQGEGMINELKKCCDNLKIVGSFEKEVRV